MSNQAYGLGGTEVKRESIESLQEIPQNRTILVEKLTQDQPLRPEMVKGLKTVGEVFQHYAPKLDLSFETSEGVESKGTLKFNNLGDFGKKGIVNQSEFLSDLDTEKEQFQKVVKQLKTNKILKAALSNPEAKEALLNTIKDMISELDNN
ncbi:hypothetical protein H0I23_00785 [Cellulophaga sp. HaHaR_3_176]|uniref:hypothetical protein n=1 Tax=Cellulophaga sp. HaHaR_3_176 TaxID=1942464 RepID=UPI001C20134E|nr:hypothetical protein [Cellulophaga sp. HaHaR_3_176]QWX84219.1 hypothetical protein H0I23_00785 [Cellulophaga sp. HaHaR_3_176]